MAAVLLLAVPLLAEPETAAVLLRPVPLRLAAVLLLADQAVQLLAVLATNSPVASATCG